MRRLDARTRLTMLFDDGKFEEFDQRLVSTDPLEFVDSKKYQDRLAASQEATHLRDAIISAGGNLNGRRVHICAMELKFVGGSMGTVVGEVITRAIERSLAAKSSAHHCLGVGRRAHAGGRRQPDANGQDLGRIDAPG